MPQYASGGYIPGPPVPVRVEYLREVEPGLSVVSINGERPEYLMSARWVRANPGKIPAGDPPESEEWRP